MKRLFLILFLFLVGCRTTQVPIPTEPVVATDSHSEVKKEYIHDSVFIKVKEYVKGDIQYRDSIVYRWKYKEVRDTIRDSIPVFVDKPVPYEKEVPKPYLPKIFIILSAIGVGAIVVLGYRTFKIFKF